MNKPSITHISEFEVDNSFELESMCDLMNNHWDLYAHVESLYEFFFISRLNEFGANLLILLNNESINDSVNVIELVDLLSLCTYQEVMSLKFFSLETLFTVYFLQVHTNTERLFDLMYDINYLSLSEIYSY